MQGIVFNPHYMTYVDVASTEYWRALQLAYPQRFVADGVDLFMVAAEQNYRDAARFDDEIDVHLRTESFGRTSFRMAFTVARGEGALVDGTATYVVGDRHSRAPRPLPDWLTRSIEDYERVPPARKMAGTSA